MTDAQDASEPLHVVAAVIADGPHVLACRRRAGRDAAGRWEFPGGKVEPGESAVQALHREIREELSIDVEVFDELTTDDTRVGARVIRLTCLRARLAGPRPLQSTDHDLLAWLPPAELAGLDWAEPDLPAVRLLTSAQ